MGAGARGADGAGQLSWELASTPPGELDGPAGLDRLEFVAAEVPGTVAGALGPDVDLDGRDWWFRTVLPAAADGDVLVLDGLATVCDVYLGGEHVARSESMFLPVRVELAGRGRELAVCCRALAPMLAERRRPRARWRTALVADGNLRWYRTMLLGRMPGSAPGPAVVGPYRPVRIEPPAPIGPVRVRTRLTEEGVGVLRADWYVRAPVRRLRARLSGPTGVHEAELRADGGELRVPGAARWWPHTHGDPALYELQILAGDELVHRCRVGFRTLAWPADWAEQGLALAVNGVELFCRGAVWTPPSLAQPHPSREALRVTLETVCDAGMNMLRIPGTACYEQDAFHDLCDELGILVWQDFMFANLDYPDSEPAFVAAAAREADFQLGRLTGRPSLAVLCGGSECAQQVTMLGLDPELGRGPLYTEILPRAVREAQLDALYIPNAPWGGELPFRPAAGVANYFGVGAYRRPLADARLSGVRFAAECLAFSNIPDGDVALPLAGVPRDAGAGWDFADVRDHYLRELYGLDPGELRSTDPARYLELGRAVTGEVIAEVLGEWRRAGSPCAGALVLWLRDLEPGAGWGLLDHRGTPKPVLSWLRRALAPVAVWSTDEGLGGIAVHVANDRPEQLTATLRVALYRDGELPVERALLPIALAPHAVSSFDLEQLVGRFVDAGWAYRFGPPAQDVIVASLEHEGSLVSQAFRFPAGRPLSPERPAALGLEAGLASNGDDWWLRIESRRVVNCVRLHVPRYVPADDCFSLEPGGSREVRLRRVGADVAAPSVTITALNLHGGVRVPAERVGLPA